MFFVLLPDTVPLFTVTFTSYLVHFGLTSSIAACRFSEVKPLVVLS